MQIRRNQKERARGLARGGASHSLSEPGLAAPADVCDSQRSPDTWGGDRMGAPPPLGAWSAGWPREGTEHERRRNEAGLRAVDVSVSSCVWNVPLWLFRW